MGDTGSLAIGGMIGRGRDLLQAGAALGRRRRRFRDRSRLGHFAGVEFQTDGQTTFSPCLRFIIISS